MVDRAGASEEVDTVEKFVARFAAGAVPALHPPALSSFDLDAIAQCLETKASNVRSDQRQHTAPIVTFHFPLDFGTTVAASHARSRFGALMHAATHGCAGIYY